MLKCGHYAGYSCAYVKEKVFIVSELLKIV